MELSTFIPLLVPIIAALCTILIKNPLSRNNAIENGEIVLKEKISSMYLELIDLWNANRDHKNIIKEFNHFIERNFSQDTYMSRDLFITEFIFYWRHNKDKITIDKIIEFSIYIEKEYWSLLKLISHQYIREKTKSTQNFFASVTTSMFRTGFYIWSYLFTFLTWVVLIVLYLNFFGSIDKEIAQLIITIYMLVVIIFMLFYAIYVSFIETHTSGYRSSNVIYEQAKDIYQGKQLSLKFRIWRQDVEHKLFSKLFSSIRALFRR